MRKIVTRWRQMPFKINAFKPAKRATLVNKQLCNVNNQLIQVKEM